jgi:hypothetical protein
MPNSFVIHLAGVDVMRSTELADKSVRLEALIDGVQREVTLTPAYAQGAADLLGAHGYLTRATHTPPSPPVVNLPYLRPDAAFAAPTLVATEPMLRTPLG